MMPENILRKLVNNSQTAIDEGVYDIDKIYKNQTKIFYK